MSTQHLSVLVPPTVAEPRGSRWSALIALQLLHLGKFIWRTLEESGQRRAALELKGMAHLCEASDPALARRLRGEVDASKTQGGIKT